jgi:TolB-like protein
MKKLFLSIVLLGCAFAVFAQTNAKPIVVVVPFDVKGVPDDEGEVIFEVFQSEFANVGVARIADRSSFEKIRKQQEFESSDWSNADKVAEVGKALNASMVVTGQLMMFKSNLVTTIKLIDVNTTEIISSVTEKTLDADDLFNKLSDMAKKLGERIASEKPKKEYKIGSVGPGGGIVFLIEDTLYYEYSEVLGNVSLFEASALCQKYNGGGFSDWYLPSKYELNRIYDCMMKYQGYGDGSYFWSSSSDYGKYAWHYMYSDATIPNFDPNGCLYVRAVRAFTN